MHRTRPVYYEIRHLHLIVDMCDVTDRNLPLLDIGGLGSP